MVNDQEIQARIWENVIPEPNSGCWLWLGGVSSSGHGIIWHEQQCKTAHTVSYESKYGPLKHNGLHKCDVKLCCNPDHVYDGTQRDNMRDAIVRGQYKVGENHHNATISDDKLARIKSASGTQKEVAAQFGVSQAYVSLVRSGKRR